MITVDRAELMRWNAANEMAKRDYYAHPIASCIIAGCDRLAEYICIAHKREATKRAQAVARSRAAQQDALLGGVA